MAAGGDRMVTFLQLILFLHASQAFRWTSESESGGNLLRCPGDNVTFPWKYVTEDGENVIVLFWFSSKNGSFAGYYADQFTTSSSRISFLGNASVTLCDVSKDDDDTYGVSVKMYGRQDLAMQTVNLTVAEPPKITDDKLHVVEEVRHCSQTGNTSCLHTAPAQKRVKCGRFLSLGSPPVSAVWTNPQGHQLPSTNFSDGYFYLDLTRHAKGGNYTCSLDSQAEAARCIQSDSPLLVAQSVYVETTETVVAEQASSLRQLQSEVKELTENVARKGTVDENTLHMEELEGRVDNLEAKNDNLTRDLDTQKIAEDQQEKTLLGNLTRLQKSFQDAVNGVEEKTQQDVQAAMDTLTDKLDTVTNNLSYHQAAQDQHGKFIGNLTHKLSDLEQTSTRHQKDNEEMKQRLTRVETVNEDQWKTAAGIQQNLTDIQDINQQLCSRQEALEEKFLTQQTVDTQLRQQLEDVEKEQEDLSSRHDLLADRVEDVHLALNDSTTQLADQLASGEAVLEEHLRAASLELNKTVDLVKRLQEKQNVLEATVEQLQRQDRGEAQTVKAMEDRITGLENLKLVNVAASQPASQSSDYVDPSGPTGADRAVDNNRSNNHQDGSCSHTANGDDHPWWRVDLGKAYNIFAVSITNRGDCCWERLRDFYVEVFTADPASDPSASATLCYHHPAAMGKGATEALYCRQSARGRFVRVRKPTHLLQLCEVEVLALVPGNE